MGVRLRYGREREAVLVDLFRLVLDDPNFVFHTFRGMGLMLRVAPDMDTGVKLKKRPTEYLRDMWFDTLVFTSEALRHLAAEVGVSQLVLGTDHPIPWQPESVDHILNAEGFSDEDRIAMLGGNAAALLGIAP